MEERVRCIVLRVVRYSDTSSMATLWSRELGRFSAVVPCGTGRSGARMRAIMQPMCAFDGIARMRPNRDVARLTDIRPVVGVSANPLAAVVALFLADFLYVTLKESGPDPLLADFLFDSAALLQRLDGTALANFHLWFLYRLGHFLGIEPDVAGGLDWQFFDMREGRYVATPPTHSQYLQPSGSHMPRLLARLRPRTLRLLRLSRQQRNQVLDGIINYYVLHYAPMTGLHSLDVVREMFA